MGPQQELRNCQHCGKLFMFRKSPSRLSTKRGMFCSKACGYHNRRTTGITFNGVRFSPAMCDGQYYVNSSTKQTLHRAIWEHHNGPIEDGMVIHHIDFDKSNNTLSNLEKMTDSAHRSLHMKARHAAH